ncbi:Ionotropic receptor 118 [Cephus cinctus]|nr:Ionotropic receptor 118 [Cephus cinctus]
MANAKKDFTLNLLILKTFLFLISTQETIIAKNPKTTTLFDTVGQLLTTCLFPSRKNVLLIGNQFLDEELKKFHETNQCLITRLGDTRPRDDQHITDAMFWLPTFLSERYYAKIYPLDIFAIKVSSASSLLKQLDRIRNSLWHNVKGKYLILDENPESENCHMAYELLHTAWQNDLLSVIFLCKDDYGKVKIYTYNPFGEYAPEPWQIVGQDSDNRPGSLFVLKDNGLEILNCHKERNIIFYDKSLKLNGYPVRVIGQVYPPTFAINTDEKMKKTYEGKDGVILTSLIADMNATMVDQQHLLAKELDFGYFYENGTYHGMLNTLILNEVDLTINSRTLVEYWNLTILYPHTQAPFCTVTKDRGNVPQWKRLLKIFDLPTITGLVTVLITILLIHKFAMGLCFVVTFLEILRMVIGTSMRHLPRNNLLRIVYGSVILLLLVFSAAFNGNFMSLLTTPLKRKNMDTLQDLDEYGYKIIGYPYFKIYFKERPKLLSRYEDEMGLKCLDNIHQLDRVACVAHCSFANVLFSQSKKVHVVIIDSVGSHAALIARRDWPFADKANVLLQRYVEAGYVEFTSDMALYEAETKLWSYFRSQQPGKIKFILLKDLIIIFWLLLAGLVCSTLVLFYELFNPRKA